LSEIDYKKVQVMQDLMSLLESPGWQYINDYLEHKKNRAQAELCSKNFTDICEVIRLQERLKMVEGVFGEINRLIEDGKRELKKEI